MYKEMETRIAVLRIYWITLIHKIPRFVTEVRNKKGVPYPPRSIHLLLAGLQRYMLDKNPESLSTEVNLHFVVF